MENKFQTCLYSHEIYGCKEEDKGPQRPDHFKHFCIPMRIKIAKKKTGAHSDLIITNIFVFLSFYPAEP